MGGEESSTGHQLLSDYIIPDIKTTHTAWVPAGGSERRAGAELGQPRPQVDAYFSPGARRRPRKGTPGARAASGRHPASVSCVAGRPRGGAAGPQRGQPVRGRWAGRLRSIPRLRASPIDRLPAWRGARFRSTFTWSSPRPPPARPRRLRRLRGGAQELVGLAKRRGGGAGVPGPAARSLPGAGGGFVCAGGVLRTLRLEAASLRS